MNVDIKNNRLVLAHCFWVLDKNLEEIKNPNKQEKKYIKSIFALNTKDVKFPVDRKFINSTISRAINWKENSTFMHSYLFASYLLEVELPTLQNVYEYVELNLTKKEASRFHKSMLFAEKNFKSFFPGKKYKDAYQDSIFILNKILHLDKDYCFH